ncbi:MAG: hypothetical protein ABW352_14205 [Polyangiales bacterium]
MRQRTNELWVIGALLLGGAIPWVGYMLQGSWSERELGLATLVLVFTARAAWSHWTTRTTPSRRP